MPEDTAQHDEIVTVADHEHHVVITPRKTLTVYTAADYARAFSADMALGQEVNKVTLDLAHLPSYDSYLAIFVQSIQKVCSARNAELEIVGASEAMQRFLNALYLDVTSRPAATEKGETQVRRRVKQIGAAALRHWDDTRKFIEFFGELMQKFAILIWKPQTLRWKDFPFLFSRAAVDAVPIVVLIGFLVGLIIGYQGAMQLKQFGADIYLANLVGISITRELGPLMTAIIVAGRSGSAFAAEIGTMKVSEEVDALRSLGFDVMRFLVMPRVLAVTIAIPFLTLFADLAGIIGGLITGLATLDITMTGFFNQLQEVMTYAHVFSGIFKSLVFGFLIAAVGCVRGMQVHGGAESVGKYTTAAVVSGIFLIILTDAIFAFIFQALDI